MAERTRSRLSRTVASGRPTIVKWGRPNETSTSTWTGYASTPKTAALRSVASMVPVRSARRRAGARRRESGVNERRPAEGRSRTRQFAQRRRRREYADSAYRAAPEKRATFVFGRYEIHVLAVARQIAVHRARIAQRSTSR